MADARKADGDALLSFADFRHSFYYGDHADMQFKFLHNLEDHDASDFIAEVLQRLGTAFDTGDLDDVRDYIQRVQADTYADDPTPQVDDAPFAPFEGDLEAARLALVSAGGVFRRDDDPMGPDGPSQQETLGMIKEFLRGTPTLTEIPVDTPPEALTARHPGYDARTAQRDPETVFPLEALRKLAAGGELQLADTHYSFVGATSQSRLRKEVADAWAQHFVAQEVDGCLLVAT